jgi:hypothetical protein
MPFATRFPAPVVVLLAALIATLGGAKADDEQDNPRIEIVGTWILKSAKYGGLPLSGIAGAELVLLENGEKRLTLPGKEVAEVGTWSVDLGAMPHALDVTTKGAADQLGIFERTDRTLRICLSAAGRPATFETKKGSDQLLLVFERSTAKPAPTKPAPTKDANDRTSAAKPAGTRSFRMGFTGFVYDVTPQAVAESRAFVRENGDILAHHIEGVPWAEALSGDPFPKALLDEWEGKKTATPPNGAVYLAISPGRGELKVHEKAGPLPKELRGKAYDDPLVMQAYLAYCRRAIEFFEPDYLGIGIEVNEIHRDGGEKTWNAYAKLHRHVYEELKKEFPQLPIFASFTLHSAFQDRGGMLASFKKLMPYNDLVAVSYYPFFVPEKDRLAALDWMTERFDEFDKPYAIVETNDSAERMPLPQAKVVLEGTSAKQAAYYRRLLALAQQRKFAFVVSFVHQDYDALWTKIEASSPELFKAWRDCGLLDQNGAERPAYQVWKDYLALPLETERRP